MWKRQKNKEDLNYDSLIKTALTGHLGEAVREVQRQQQQQQQQQASATVEGNSEAAHTLCCVIEALFIHRLRDSFIDKVSNVFSGDVVRQPAPNFFPFLLGFSHRHSVDFITDSCPWLRTDIGRCRGWIRLVINDGMLSSYLELLAGERRLLGDFYDRQAYLRDPEHLDIARKLLSGLEMIQFKLAVNSNMLNNWSPTPLLLAGLWSPPTPLVQEAVVQGVDAALCFTDEDETLQPVKQVTRSITPNRSVPKVDADLAYRLILESERNGRIPSDVLPPIESTQPLTIPALATSSSSTEARLSQSLPPRSSHQPTDADSDNVLVTRLKLKNSRPPSPAVEKAKVEVESEKSPVAVIEDECHLEEIVSDDSPLREEHYEECPTIIGTSENMAIAEDQMSSSCTFEDLLVDYSNLNMAGGSSAMKSPDNPLLVKGISTESADPGFEVVSGEQEPQSPFVAKLMTLNQESSLAQQDYRCAGCGCPIGLIYGPTRVCGFTGCLYCCECHLDDESVIPARVFLNGDWSKRKVCHSVYTWFKEVELEPLLDAVRFNRHIYTIQRDFSNLLTLRTQLQHLSAFLLSCRTSDTSDEFRKRNYGKEYLFQQQHTYAMADLPLVHSGQLHQQLTKLATFGKQHVAGCNLCSLKGFLCEACHSDSVIFPFDLESTYRCSVCGAVYHSSCMDRFKPCPRCERWKKKALERQQQIQQQDQEEEDELT